MCSAERKLQLTLNNLQKWANDNGFKFSESKTVVVHFCNQRKLHPDPYLTLNNVPLPVENEFKFLGITFDKKLSFVAHLKLLKLMCSKSLNLLRVVAHKDWGGDFATLIKLYRSLIRSKLDYGSVVYGSARKSYLQMLDPILNQSLKLCLGAFRTSQTDSLQVEARESSLALRRQKLSLQYLFKMKANTVNPASKCTFDFLHKNVFDSRPNLIAPFGIRRERLCHNIGIDLNVIAPVSQPSVPSWR